MKQIKYEKYEETIINLFRILNLRKKLKFSNYAMI
jgi:hypothetical protein